MKESNGETIRAAHAGGDTSFWQDDRVEQYDRRQAKIVENKREMLESIVKIVAYFCDARALKSPTILDVGCGPGTLTGLLLERIPGATVVAVDASDQMVEAAKQRLSSQGDRFAGFVGDYNSPAFWSEDIDREYDIIASSISLHYLSDQRREAFFKKVHARLTKRGIFAASIGTRSNAPEIAKMEQTFRAQYLWDNLDPAKRPQDFNAFAKDFIEEKETSANINWQSHEEYLRCMKTAGFKEADVVWQLWIKSIFVGVK